METVIHKSSVQFVLDNPLTDLAQDTLNRQKFVEATVQGILNWNGADGGLVLAIYGTWGSGKTTTKSFILNELEKYGDKAPLIREFNPWRIPVGMEALAEQFLREIANNLKLANPAEVEKEGQAVKYFSKLLEIAQRCMSTMSKFAPGTVEGTALLQVANGVKVVQKAAKYHSEMLTTQAKYLEENIDDLRTRVLAEMHKYKRKLLVVIDDLDRLSAVEIRLMFQLVKANADLPNVAFLLLCQRDVVEASLAESLPIELNQNQPIGRNFLEKIVHVGLTLPELNVSQKRSSLQNILAATLPSNSFKKADLNETVDLIHVYFQSIRHIVRLQTSLSFQVSIFTENGQLLLNAMDLVLLDVLRRFESDIYAAIPMHKDSLLGEPDVKTARNSLSEKARKDKQVVVRQILARLFPDPAGRRQLLLSKKTSICADETFDYYFNLFVPSDNQLCT